MRTFSEVRRDHLRRWANIPRMYQNITLDDYDIERGNKEAYEQIVEYANNWQSYESRGIGLCLIGPPGVAKTWLTCAVLLDIIDSDHSAYFTTLDQYVKDYQHLIELERVNDPIEETVTEYRRLSKKLDLIKGDGDEYFAAVAFDDVGKEHKTSSGWAGNLFDTALRTRYSNGRPTLLTSNLPVSKWDKEYSDSMRSYVQEACIIVSVVSDDYRTTIRDRR